MTISRFTSRSLCLSLSLVVLLAGCHKAEPTAKPESTTKSAATVAAALITAPSIDPRVAAQNMSSAQRQAELADERWAKEAAVYDRLMKKAAQAGDSLSDKDTLALGEELYNAHVTFRRVAGSDFNRVLPLLRAESVGSKQALQGITQFSNKLRVARTAAASKATSTALKPTAGAFEAAAAAGASARAASAATPLK